MVNHMFRVRVENERINFTSKVEFACSNRKIDLLESTFEILLNLSTLTFIRNNVYLAEYVIVLQIEMPCAYDLRVC